MRSPTQSAEDAKGQTDALIGRLLDKARAEAAAGDRAAALHDLGVAMHPMMDRTSSHHTDANGLPKVWRGMGFQSLPHAREAVAVPVYGLSDDALRSAYSYVFRSR
jgi:hypothetical protein